MMILALCLALGDDWLQLKGDARRSGDVPSRALALPLGLAGAVPLGDGIYASPAVADGVVYVVDGSGSAHAIEAATLRTLWKSPPRGVNHVSSPAVAGKHLHFGTTDGFHVVLDRATGALVRELDVREPIFSAPAGGSVTLVAGCVPSGRQSRACVRTKTSL